jgi:hypothetical protein
VKTYNSHTLVIPSPLPIPSGFKNDATARMRTDTARILLKSGMQKRPLFEAFRSADLKISPYLQGVHG